MASERLFRPALVCSLGRNYLAVDELQPVAVMFSQHGEIVAVQSWEQLPPPVSGWTWPKRRLASSGPTAWLTELSNGLSVSLTADGRDGVHVALGDPPDDAVARGSKYSAFSVSHRRVGVDDRTWTYRSQLEQFRWESNVVVESNAASRTWKLGRGSIACAAAMGATTAVCVRRADKRPWKFSAPHDLYILSSENEVRMGEPVRLTAVDIASRCWKRERVVIDNARALTDYLPYSVAECQGALRAGAQNVRLDVGGIESTPVIEISFELACAPDVRFRRIDIPVDELGNESGGLRDLSIFLDEDLGAGVEAVGLSGSSREI